jgi:hypothetical protein
MIALVVLTVGCLGVVGMFVLADQAAAQSAAYDDAAWMAREVMESTRAVPYDELLRAGRDGEELIGPFQRRWALQPDRPEAGLATLSVEVIWHDARGRARRLELGMVRADPRAG